MFLLNPAHFSCFSLVGARNFVNYWSQFYRDDVKDVATGARIDYYAELNAGGQLTAQNVERLLRWKDPRFLTHPQRRGPNQKVVAAAASLCKLNAFRAGTMCQQSFLQFASGLFPNGFVYTMFLFHISTPLQYPIIDRYTLLAFERHTGVRPPTSWAEYQAYQQYFTSIVQACSFPPASDHVTAVRQHKVVDDALMEFGRFLARYDTQPGLGTGQSPVQWEPEQGG